MGVAAVICVVAIPPFNNTGDIWNQGRQYAVTFTDQNGEIIGRRGIRQDDAVPIQEIEHVVNAVLATEDARFYSHFGIDLQGLARAMLVNAQANEVVQGGSTLTQQLAKICSYRRNARSSASCMRHFWRCGSIAADQGPDPEDVSRPLLSRRRRLWRRGGGAILFRQVDPRREPVGGGDPGRPVQGAVELCAPCQCRGGEGPRQCGALPDARCRLHQPGRAVRAKQHPAEVVNQSAFYSPDWFLDWAYKETLDVINEQNLTSEYVIEVKSTIDLAMQKVAQRIVNEKLEKEAPAYRATQAALVAMTPDGAVRAIVGGKDYEASQFNRATDALRQPGSSFKPFVYLAALKAGFKPTSIVYDSPVSVGSWTPKNYTLKYAGRTTLTNALAHSYNSVPVHLMLQIGRKAIIETAHECGLKSNLLSIASLPLGTNEVTLLDLTTGYATFANGGKLAVPHTVLEIRRPTGELLYSREANAPPPKQVEPEDKIADLNVMMNQVVMGGTGQRALLGFTPQAGKTGTNQSYRDAWFIGYTGQLVTGVWYGNDDFKEMKKATGGTIPALTWHDFMVEALAGRQPVALVGLPVLESHIKLAAANKATVETAMADQQDRCNGVGRRGAEAPPSGPADALAAADAALAEGLGEDNDEPQKSDAGAFCRTCSPCSGSSRCRTRQQVERRRVRQGSQVVQRQQRSRDSFFFFNGFGRSNNFSSRFKRDWTRER